MLSLSVAHVHLLVAILAEVVATSSLKASDGLSRPLPTAVVVIGYAVAFYFLALACAACRSAWPTRSGQAPASYWCRWSAGCCSARRSTWPAGSASR